MAATTTSEEGQDITSEVNSQLLQRSDQLSENAPEGHTFSTFRFEHPHWMRRSLELADNSNIDPATSDSLFDEDGDLIEVKRQRIIPKEGEVTIEHALASNLEGVGYQIWRGSLYLGDYLLSKEKIVDTHQGLNVLELGAGTGLLSLVAAIHPSVSKVTSTDLAHIVTLTERNIRRNLRNNEAHIEVLPLDLTADNSDILNRLGPTVDLIVGADLIYDDTLTQALVCFFRNFAEARKKGGVGKSFEVLLSFEKRWNFTLDSMSVTAPAFDYLMASLAELKEASDLVFDFECTFIDDKDTKGPIPQYFCYERSADLQILHINFHFN